MPKSNKSGTNSRTSKTDPKLIHITIKFPSGVTQEAKVLKLPNIGDRYTSMHFYKSLTKISKYKYRAVVEKIELTPNQVMKELFIRKLK